MSEAGDPRKTARWRALVASILKPGPLCYWCRRAKATEGDHLLAVVDGGPPFDRRNVVPACRACNRRRGQIVSSRRRARAQARFLGPGQDTPAVSKNLSPPRPRVTLRADYTRRATNAGGR
jgi:uncharacterized membrane protein